MRVALICLVLCAQLSFNVWAQEQSSLVVGTKTAPPFSIQSQDQQWEGLSIELWEKIAGRLGYSSRYEALNLSELIEELSDGKIDIAVAALTVTREREEQVDFTHPFFVSGLGIAVGSKMEGGWFVVLSRFISEDFLKIIVVLIGILLLTGFLIWLFERKKNPDQFPDNPLQGIGAGLWWSAVTMTTVGYGDKAPQSIGGRLMGLIWMFAGLIFISSFTAAITTALTVDELSNKINSPKDLVHVVSGAVEGSTSQAYLQKKRYEFVSFENLEEALKALKQKKIQAVVHDKPILSFQVSRKFKPDLHVLDVSFEKQYYAFALKSGSIFREPINRELLELISKPEWKDLRYKYLGDSED